VILFAAIACRYFLFISILQINKEYLREEALIVESKCQLVIAKQDLYKSNNKLIWKDDNQEVEINNEMFEVISLKEGKNVFVIELVKDIKETSWLNTFLNFNLKKNLLLSLLNLLNQFQFFMESKIQKVNYFVTNAFKYLTFKTQFKLNFLVFEIIKPPCK
jgi:hypothetical protein